MANTSKTAKRKSRTAKPNGGNSKSLVFTRSFASIIAKSGTDTGNFRSIALSDFTNSDITSMFQEYRIRSVTIEWNLASSPNAVVSFPLLYTAPQHFATFVAPSNREEVMQFDHIKSHQFGPSAMKYSRSFNPNVFLDTEGGGRMYKQSPWLSVVVPGVKHYLNTEWITRYSTLDPTHTIEVVITAQIEVRGTR